MESDGRHDTAVKVEGPNTGPFGRVSSPPFSDHLESSIIRTTIPRLSAYSPSCFSCYRTSDVHLTNRPRMSISSQGPPTPTRTSASGLAASLSTSQYSTTRRHSLYGTEDRIIIDPGSRVWKVGFSGEGKPRDVFLASDDHSASSLWNLNGTSEGEEKQNEERRVLECRLQDQLRRVFLE